MELDELKNTWVLYDKKLNRSLKFNEEVLRKLNLDKSKREMNTPLNSEVLSVVVGAIFMLFIISVTIRFFSELKFSIPGILTSILYAFPFIFSIQKLRLLSNIDYYNSTIIDLQKSISKLKHKYFQAKKFDLYIFPIFIVLGSPILVKALRNIDLYEYPLKFICAVIFALAVGYPVAFWIYKNWYEKKIQNTEQFLKEIERFENEN
jgi:hypothetical protein